MDLLSAVMHEMGHIIGLDHDDQGVMDYTLESGTRTTSNDTAMVFDEQSGELISIENYQGLKSADDAASRIDFSRVTEADEDDDWKIII